MLFIKQNFSTNPYFNLALEEYLFKQKSEDICMLWQNKNAIIVGKHQNALAEINIDYAKQNNIDIVRRLSGGGTVYHDLGNVNFTFMMNGEREKLVDFSRFLNPIITALKTLGVEAKQGKRNELLVAGKKISGNAEHTFKNRVLHHGTLLFNSDLSHLIKSLRINPFKYQDKAIKSVQSRVCNLIDYLPQFENAQDFSNSLFDLLIDQMNGTEYQFSKTELDEIEQLMNEKYLLWDWNFGYSPNYVLNKEIDYKEQIIPISISVKKGLIIEISSEKLEAKALETLQGFLINKKHHIEELVQDIDSSQSDLKQIITQLY